jgi:hypothetical protein
MYEAFDDFLHVSTWHTRHPSDEERFFRALAAVVRNPQFNADALGKYIDQKREGGEIGLIDEVYDDARDHYVDAAWAVSDYLRITNE